MGVFEVTDYESKHIFRINAQFCVHGTIQLSYNFFFFSTRNNDWNGTWYMVSFVTRGILRVTESKCEA